MKPKKSPLSAAAPWAIRHWLPPAASRLAHSDSEKNTVSAIVVPVNKNANDVVKNAYARYNLSLGGGLGDVAGKNVDAATEAADALDDAVAKLGTDAQGLADQALAITPADFNGDKDVVDPLREKGKAVRADGKAVRAAAKTVRTELRRCAAERHNARHRKHRR